jgi:predicted transcriptional regulator
MLARKTWKRFQRVKKILEIIQLRYRNYALTNIFKQKERTKLDINFSILFSSEHPLISDVHYTIRL